MGGREKEVLGGWVGGVPLKIISDFLTAKINISALKTKAKEFIFFPS